VLSIVLGRLIARAVRMPDYAWKLSLILGTLLVSTVVVVNRWPPKFGVDLRGGVNIIGQFNKQELRPGEQPVAPEAAVTRMRRRIDPSGTREIMIRTRGVDQLEIVIPDVDRVEAERLWKRLITAGHLQFRIVADERFHPAAIAAARQAAPNRARDIWADRNPETDVYPLARWYYLGNVDPDSPDARKARDVLPFKFMPQRTHLIRDAKTGEIIEWADVAANDPETLARWCRDRGISDVQILLAEPSSERFDVEGRHLAAVRAGIDDLGQPAVHFNLNAEGGKRFGALTQANLPDSMGLPRLLGIVLDDRLVSAPSIEARITTSGIIHGRFTQAEVDDLIAILSAGRLDVSLRKNWISMDQRESSLGANLRKQGVISMAVAMAVVLAFMLYYYRFAGIVADLALLANTLLTIAVLMIIKQPLTMTGLAGLVLTIAMAVDANVLIYERIREELRRGAALRMAIRNGFDRAMATIIDSNLTTIFTAIILYVIGTEQLKSFAVALIVGIGISMFTAVFCSRVVIEICERRRWITNLPMVQVFPNVTLDFVSRFGLFLAISLIAIVVGLAAAVYRGSGIFDRDLAGGSAARMVLQQPADVEDIRAELDQTNYTFNDDQPVQFEVSNVLDERQAGRVFLVESNLPALEGDADDPESENLLRLDKILVDVFGDRLAHLEVDFDPGAIRVVEVNNDGTVTPQSPESSTEPPGSTGKSSSGAPAGNQPGARLTRPASAELTATTWRPLASSLALWLTDPSAAAPRQEESKSSDPAKNDQSAPSESAAASDNAPQQPPAEAQTPPETQPPPESAAPASQAGRYRATCPMKFAYPIQGEALKGAILDAAQALGDVPIEESDITLGIEGVAVEQLDTNAHSTEWVVTLMTTHEGDAQRVLAQMESTLEGQAYFPSTSGVGGQVAAESQVQALIALLAGLVMIIAYVWVRFQNIAFGFAAVIALVHDVLITIGAIAISYWIQGAWMIDNFKISLSVVAALLTIIGYSINDTIVIFDRIREVRGKRTELTREMINVSVSQTLSRTILTSLITLLVVLALFLFGGDAIHAFSFALVVGVIAGSYSTIFIASPILLWLMNRRPALQPAK